MRSTLSSFGLEANILSGSFDVEGPRSALLQLCGAPFCLRNAAKLPKCKRSTEQVDISSYVHPQKRQKR